MRYRYYFLEALLITCALFVIGFLIGLGIEQARNEYLRSSYYETEKDLLELKEQLNIKNLGRFTCEELSEKNFEIGNKIYEQALIFAEYESSAIFTKSQMIREHRKFDLLRTSYWINSIEIKNRCGKKVFSTLVYLYDYPAETNNEIAKQKVIEGLTYQIKSSAESEIILIPIAKNLDIPELDGLISKYNLNSNSVALIVDEKDVFFYSDISKIREYFEIDR